MELLKNDAFPSGLRSTLQSALQGLAPDERVYLERFGAKHPELKKALQSFAQEKLLSGWTSVIETYFQDIAVVHRTIPSQPNLWQISAASKLAPQPVVSAPLAVASPSLSPASTASLPPAHSASAQSKSNVLLIQTNEGAFFLYPFTDVNHSLSASRT